MCVFVAPFIYSLLANPVCIFIESSMLNLDCQWLSEACLGPYQTYLWWSFFEKTVKALSQKRSILDFCEDQNVFIYDSQKFLERPHLTGLIIF